MTAKSAFGFDINDTRGEIGLVYRLVWTGDTTAAAVDVICTNTDTAITSVTATVGGNIAVYVVLSTGTVIGRTIPTNDLAIAAARSISNTSNAVVTKIIAVTTVVGMAAAAGALAAIITSADTTVATISVAAIASVPFISIAASVTTSFNNIAGIVVSGITIGDSITSQ